MERLRGRYWMGDRHLLIAEGMTPSATLVVMVHEMTHYLQYKHGKWDYTSAGKCWAEHQAFDVSNITARALNDPSMVVDWNLMRIQYNCPL
jgi:predicted SprT family Zn-dependent metalloprotease